MKILFFASYYHPYISGITTLPKQILEHLAKKHQVTVLCFKHQSDLPSQAVINQVKVVRMPFLLKVFKAFFSLRSWLYFFKYIRQADLLILNLPNAEALPLACLAKLFGKKIISVYYCQVKFDQGFLKKIAAWLLHQLVLGQLRLSDLIVTLTKDYWQSLGWTSVFKEKVRFILPGLENPQPDFTFKRQLQTKKQPHIAKKEIWVGYVGRIASEKGLNYLAQAVSQLAQNNQQAFRLVLAGPLGEQVVGEADYYQQFLANLKKLKLKYSFLGLLTKPQLVSLYQVLDVLVLPSVNQTEAFGLVQVEAMLAGTPVVASDLPGVRVPVQKTGLGQVVEVKDQEKLIQALKYWSRQKNDKFNQVVYAKKEKTQQFFSKQKFLSNWESIITL